jgi:hypothetical protein
MTVASFIALAVSIFMAVYCTIVARLSAIDLAASRQHTNNANELAKQTIAYNANASRITEGLWDSENNTVPVAGDWKTPDTPYISITFDDAECELLIDILSLYRNGVISTPWSMHAIDSVRSRIGIAKSQQIGGV